MELINFIRPELLILPVLLYGLGMLLKKTKLKDNFIPIILSLTGIICGIVYCGIVEGFSLGSIGIGLIQGFLCASASTNVNQVIKQMKKLGDKKADLAEEIVDKLS